MISPIAKKIVSEITEALKGMDSFKCESFTIKLHEHKYPNCVVELWARIDEKPKEVQNEINM